MISEHPDNERFFADVQAWMNHPIKRIKSNRFSNVDEVFAARKIMSTIQGAPCTIEMKKRPRFEYQHPLDLHLFGMTCEETSRIKNLEENNPELNLKWLLVEAGMSKEDCLNMVRDAGIELPAMYQLGYKNNNCIGCVKATSPAYWNKIRRDFPETFEKRAIQSRTFNSRLVRIAGERRFLDELSPDVTEEILEDLSCGPQCAASDLQ